MPPRRIPGPYLEVAKSDAINIPGSAAVMCSYAQIAAQFERTLQRCWQTIQGEQTMRRSAFRSRESVKLPIAWREAEYARLRANAADTCDDRVSESIFDIEDEHAEVDIIVRGTMRGES